MSKLKNPKTVLKQIKKAIKKDKLQILFTEDAPIDEIVDSIADAMTAGIIVEMQLKDGFQFQDLLSALQIQPIVREIVDDAPTFIQQFLKLNPNTAVVAVTQAKNRLVSEGKEFGVITNAIMNFLYVAASNYGFALNAYTGGQAQYLLWQTLIGGGEVFPPTTKVS